MNIKNLALAIAAASCVVSMSAEEYVVVGKEAKVFDEPKATGYVTLNTKNEEVTLQPGMVFKALENSKGWFIIEYSPGLRGYFSEQAKAAKTTLPAPGTYTVRNQPALKLKAELNGDIWKATVGDKIYSGTPSGGAIIFFDKKQQAAFSLVDLGEGPVAMTYDNKTTKFF